MIDLDLAKEILLKKNKDGTYNLTAIIDMYDSDSESIIANVEFNYPKVIIKSFDAEALVADNDVIAEFTTK